MGCLARRSSVRVWPDVPMPSRAVRAHVWASPLGCALALLAGLAGDPEGPLLGLLGLGPHQPLGHTSRLGNGRRSQREACMPISFHTSAAEGND